MTLSRHLHLLIDSGLVYPRENKLNKYILTERGRKVVKAINKL